MRLLVTNARVPQAYINLAQLAGPCGEDRRHHVRAAPTGRLADLSCRLLSAGRSSLPRSRPLWGKLLPFHLGR